MHPQLWLQKPYKPAVFIAQFCLFPGRNLRLFIQEIPQKPINLSVASVHRQLKIISNPSPQNRLLAVSAHPTILPNANQTPLSPPSLTSTQNPDLAFCYTAQLRGEPGSSLP